MPKNQPTTILLVEDNRLIAFSLKAELETLGFFVRVAHTADGAVELVKENRPNLILMDVNLNDERDGIDVMKQIHNEIGFISNIYLSGYAYDEVNARAKDTAPMAIFDKPVNTAKLVNTIRDFEIDSGD